MIAVPASRAAAFEMDNQPAFPMLLVLGHVTSRSFVTSGMDVDLAIRRSQAGHKEPGLYVIYYFRQ